MDTEKGKMGTGKDGWGQKESETDCDRQTGIKRERERERGGSDRGEAVSE